MATFLITVGAFLALGVFILLMLGGVMFISSLIGGVMDVLSGPRRAAREREAAAQAAVQAQIQTVLDDSRHWLAGKQHSPLAQLRQHEREIAARKQ